MGISLRQKMGFGGLRFSDKSQFLHSFIQAISYFAPFFQGQISYPVSVLITPLIKFKQGFFPVNILKKIEESGIIILWFLG